MALTNQQRATVRANFVEQALEGQPCAYTKTQLNAAIDAVDTWCTSNTASFVAALPEPFKSASSTGQKAALLSFVTEERFGG